MLPQLSRGTFVKLSLPEVKVQVGLLHFYLELRCPLVVGRSYSTLPIKQFTLNLQVMNKHVNSVR